MLYQHTETKHDSQFTTKHKEISTRVGHERLAEIVDEEANVCWFAFGVLGWY